MNDKLKTLLGKSGNQIFTLPGGTMSKMETDVIASRMRSKWLRKLGFKEIFKTFKSDLIYPYYIIHIYHSNK